MPHVFLRVERATDLGTQALSFSNIEEKHLVSLGVRQQEAPKSKVIPTVNSFFSTSEQYRTITSFWSGNDRGSEGKGALLTASMKKIAQTTSLVVSVWKTAVLLFDADGFESVD